MAVTENADEETDGRPSSWSAAIDEIISGAEEEDTQKRLFFISAGNTTNDEIENVGYPDANLIHAVESPGQAWNAITVGAYSKEATIKDDYYKNKGYKPVASINQISPYSSTSFLWGSKWPIKPEVLFDGGNIATNDEHYTDCEDLSLLTTNSKPLEYSFNTINATSAATAQAAWFAAQIYSEYPNIWPETVRALIIHSATWSKEMKEQFCINDNKRDGRKKLLRTCGYGIPNLKKAIQCLNNDVNMVIEDELQPYDNDKMNEMHFHELPWPTEVLQEMGETSVKLKVTLSYFIEPGPGEVGWDNKYRYPSCGLRFDIQDSNETREEFKERINEYIKEKNKSLEVSSSGDKSEKWYLGHNNRDIGSIHSDYCELSAVHLCYSNYIAVYPVVGWWRTRKHLGKSNCKVRYSLVVSLSTPDTSIDLYTPIMNKIENTIDVNVVDIKV